MLYEFRDERTGAIVSKEYPIGEAPKPGERVDHLTRIFSMPSLARHTMARHSRRAVKGFSLPRRGKDVVEAPAYDASGVASFGSQAEIDSYVTRCNRAGVPMEYKP